jgi:hypothetical protein
VQHNGAVQNGQEKSQGGVSPIKEHTFLHRETSLNRETSADDFAKEEQQEGSSKA